MVSLARYLPALNWRVSVLTVHPLAYIRTDSKNLSLLPGNSEVIRCFAVDTQRHFSLFGRYPGWLAVPDRWRSWIITGVANGMKLIQRDRPDIILSSFPIASANVIASRLHQKSSIPWLADFRDPMVFATHPPPGKVRSAYDKIEKDVFRRASCVTVTTNGAASLYRERYSDAIFPQVKVIENGYDEDMFKDVTSVERGATNDKKISVLHSGLVYEEARNPTPLFKALLSLIESGEIGRDEIELVFRASNRESFIVRQAKEYGIESIVSLRPPISYSDAIREMHSCDSLLLLQSAACNRQIPAKAYEYLRCGRPILAITDPVGDTGRLLAENGVRDIAALEDGTDITRALASHIRMLRNGTFAPQDSSRIKLLSRQARVSEFANTMASVCSQMKQDAR